MAPTPDLTAAVSIVNLVDAAAAAGSAIENAPAADDETLAVLSEPAGSETPVAVTVAPESGLPY
ncbi:unannotated protein [freshwater metagenome]|uniref:Unannotated protein n=1 Tax=freshwater metagenome TaxID=449393 RepID=A0A6J7V9W7_9ZZZZ